jgi:hypothetical protein
MITITPQLFEAYLKCPTKSFLRSLGETGSGNPYAEWISTRNTLYARKGIKRLREDIANYQTCARAIKDRFEMTESGFAASVDKHFLSTDGHLRNLQDRIFLTKHCAGVLPRASLLRRF